MDPENPYPDDVKKAMNEKIDAATEAGNFERCAKLLDKANAVLPPKHRVKMPPLPEPPWKESLR